MVQPRQHSRRFPAPWRVVEVSDEGLAVEDANGFQLTYLYFEDDPGRRFQTGRLTRDEARRIAAGGARLPELLGGRGGEDEA